MKHKLLTAVFGAALLTALVSCDNGTSPTVLPPVSPIEFFGNWTVTENSVYDIVQGPRFLEVKEDWSFVYTGGKHGDLDNPLTPAGLFASDGGFSQAKQVLPLPIGPDGGIDNYDYYPPIIVEGNLIYDGEGYYIFSPTSGKIDLRMLYALGAVPEENQYIDLPDSTVQNFREYAKISLSGSSLVVDDHPDSVTGGIGFLNGTWTKQP
jgi:hypothetical protein